MASVVNTVTGKSRQLDRKPQPDEQVTEEDAADAPKLARRLTQQQKDIVELQQPFVPRRIDFEDITVDATGLVRYRFVHRFGGRVRWWVVDWSGGAGAALLRDGQTDANVLVLVSVSAGVATVRVEEAG